MEEKIFDLLEKVYIELQETKQTFNKRFDGVDARLDGIDGRLDSLEGRFSKLEFKVEHDVSNKLDALFEFRDEALRRFDRLETKLDALSDKVEKHDISIQVIQGGKEMKTI